MALVNSIKREINAKIVYFGPSEAGKTTCLNFIFRKLKAEYRSQQRSIALQQDRLMYFDFMPPGQAGSNEYDVRFHIYTLSGTVHDESSWKMLLKGVDGIVFVADSGLDRLDTNQQSMNQLFELLAQYQRGVRDLPCILQCNKSDAHTSLTTEEMRAALDWRELPVTASVATSGEGVLEGLFQVVKMVMQELRTNVIACKSPGGTVPLAMDEQDFPAPPSPRDTGETDFAMHMPLTTQADKVLTSVRPAIPFSTADIAVNLLEQPTVRDGRTVSIPLQLKIGEVQLRLEVVVSASPCDEKVVAV